MSMKGMEDQKKDFGPPVPIVTIFDYDESETETGNEEASDTEDTFSVEELENAVFVDLDDGE